MQCHQCSYSVPLAGGDRVEFRQDCEQCGADLHVCLNCGNHDPDAYNECREPAADRISDRKRANRCDAFRPGFDTQEMPDNLSSAGREWEALFKKK